MSVEFVLSASSIRQLPRDRLPEVAFVGRSNVGKSSLLNTLLMRGGRRKSSRGPVARRHLAQISRTPGRTRTLNFYRIEGEFYFVDLPGYGYARVSRKALDEWHQLTESYLLDRDTLRLVVLIVDSRHGATRLDEQMRGWLMAHQKPFVVVASKSDKLRAAERVRAIRTVEQQVGSVLPFSAKTAEGLPALWSVIREALTS